jgi:hypothetical protein
VREPLVNWRNVPVTLDLQVQAFAVFAGEQWGTVSGRGGVSVAIESQWSANSDPQKVSVLHHAYINVV